MSVRLKSKEGFSIILVLVIAGVSSILILGTVAMLVAQRQQMANLRVSTIIDDLESRVRETLVSADSINRSMDWNIFNPTGAPGVNRGNQILHRCLYEAVNGPGSFAASGAPGWYDVGACPAWPALTSRAIAFRLFSPLSTAANPFPMTGGGMTPTSNPTVLADYIRLGQPEVLPFSYVYYLRNGSDLCLSVTSVLVSAQDAYKCPIRARTGFAILPLGVTPQFANPCPAPGPCLYFTYQIERYQGDAVNLGSWITARPFEFNNGQWNPQVVGGNPKNFAQISGAVGPFPIVAHPTLLDVPEILNAR